MTIQQFATRRTIWMVAKLALAGAILTYLLTQAHDGFSRLLEQSIAWPLVAVGMLCTFAAATCSFMRWHLLIRAVGIHSRLIDTLRLGALGLAMNFVSPGSIGGDFFKAVFLAHGNPGRRTEAVATVVADRVMGLLTMLLIASGGILAGGILDASSPPLRVLCRVILIATVVAWTAATVLLFLPRRPEPMFARQAASTPLVGATLVRLLAAAHTYRGQKHTLLRAFGLSVLVALFFASSYYFVARGLPIAEPTWTEHLMIVPVAGLVGAIPITPSGLGTVELAVEELYRAMPGSADIRRGDGTLVALTRRATELMVALLGLVFYLTHRREVEEVYEEAEEMAEAE
jgi:glycosyltransferase 2 family protein